MISIVCTFDNNYAEHCAVMLSSLFANNKNESFEIFILHDGLNEEVKGKFVRSFQSNTQATFQFLTINKDDLQGAPVTHHISLATYFRLFIPYLLPHRIKKVLFMDSDMIVVGPIKELWETDVANHYLAATVAAGMDEYPTEVGLKKDSLYFNAGLMLINLEKWRAFDLLPKSLKLINEEKERIKWWDQDVLNILFVNQWLPIHLRWNYQPFVYKNELKKTSSTFYKRYVDFGYYEAQKKPVVIHFAGGDKPWTTNYRLIYSLDYLKYRKMTEWAMETKYSAYKVRISSCKRAIKKILQLG